MYGVYIERYMNPRWKLTNANIDMEKRVINYIMEFFYKWCDSEVFSKRGSNKSNQADRKIFFG